MRRTATVFFSPGREISSGVDVEEKLQILEDRITVLQQELEYILKNLNEDNMAGG